MALCSSVSLFTPITSQTKLTSKPLLSPTPPKWHGILTKSNTSTRFLLNAGFNEIEPDLNEDPKDEYATNGVDPDVHQVLQEAEDNEEFQSNWAKYG